jgi:putative tricarboxylic transport membrane protein
VTAIIMLAGIFYGAQYGGTITSVLLRLPGEASSVVTVFDGFALARQGKAGTALGIAAIGSFIGGTVSIVALTLVAPFVAGFALDFGPPEYTALALLGILLVATVGGGSRTKAVVLGFLLGILPGGGATIASLVAYAVEKRRAKNPERFGKGAVEGVAAPETANNAAATSSFIPLLTLGIPANATMAVIYGALLIQGVSVGPRLVTDEPDLFWGVVNSMYIGNILLLIMSIPLVWLFVKILRVRPAILAPITVLITLIGVYTVNNSVFDIGLVIVFGAVGYLMKKLGFEPGPLVLAFVLGSLLEDSLRRSLLIFDGDPTGFLSRPISGTLLLIFLLVILLPIITPTLARRRAPRRETTPSATKELV